MEFLGIRTRSGAIVQPNSGEEMIRKFQFAYSTPNLTTGVTVYSPTVGDILLDAWIEVDTAFNGTTPMADISQFTGGNSGWFSFDGPGPVSLHSADTSQLDTAGTVSAFGDVEWPAAGGGPASPIGAVSLSLATDFGYQVASSAFSQVLHFRTVPAKFTSPNPVKLVVSQNGQRGGVATGATQGAGTVYFLTGTPQ